MSAVAKTTAGVLGLSDTQQTMRATLDIVFLLLAGYLTLTDGISKLLRVIYCHLTHMSTKTSTYLYSLDSQDIVYHTIPCYIPLLDKSYIVYKIIPHNIIL